ncbi:hypothetical protein [Mammaliicoccus sciuri]|nr:hypothetical protein [Mammaliicoccus sciuri]
MLKPRMLQDRVNKQHRAVCIYQDRPNKINTAFLFINTSQTR